MSLQTPTTAELNSTIVAQLEVAFAANISFLPRSFCRTLAKIVAGATIILYKYAGFIFLQMFVQWASAKTTTINGKKVVPLVEWGRLVGAGDPVEATRWKGEVDVTVLEQVGSLAAQTQLVNVSTGVTYLTLSEVLLDASVVTVPLRASGDQDLNGGRGTIGNLDVGNVISFVNPVPEVVSDVVVSATTEQGADAEAVEVYRQRVIDRFRAQPQGGALIDYKFWGEEVAGIINVYPYRGDPGEVDVYSEATPESSGNEDGIPTAAQLEAVKDNIELDSGGLASRRPVNAFVNSLPISRTPFDVAVSSLQVENEDDVKSQIGLALDQYFLSREPFIAGVSLGRRKDRITRSAVAGAVQDVVNANDGVFSGISLDSPGGVTEVYSLQEGEKAKTGNVTYL